MLVNLERIEEMNKKKISLVLSGKKNTLKCNIHKQYGYNSRTYQIDIIEQNREFYGVASSYDVAMSLNSGGGLGGTSRSLRGAGNGVMDVVITIRGVGKGILSAGKGVKSVGIAMTGVDEGLKGVSKSVKGSRRGVENYSNVGKLLSQHLD